MALFITHDGSLPTEPFHMSVSTAMLLSYPTMHQSGSSVYMRLFTKENIHNFVVSITHIHFNLGYLPINNNSPTWMSKIFL